MQAAKPGRGNDLSIHGCVPFSFSPGWGLLSKSKMRPVLAVVADVFVSSGVSDAVHSERSLSRASPAGSCQPALRNANLPRTLEADSPRLNAKALHHIDGFLIKVRTAIEYPISGSRVIGGTGLKFPMLF
jgi:hypothetical protein